MNNFELADALETLAGQIEVAPVELVGASIRVGGGHGGGSATGLRIDVVAGQQGTRTVGMQVNVSPAAYSAKASSLVADLREAATASRKAMPAKSWIMGLLERAQGLGNRALETTVTTAAAAIVKAFM